MSQLVLISIKSDAKYHSMRTLTQVWVFLVSLTVLLLVLGFQLKGRLGLFISLMLSLFLMYILLHRGFLLFRKHASYTELKGSDPSGFLQLLNSLKASYGIRSLHFYLTPELTPPLVWKDYPNYGYIVVHDQLLFRLTEKERMILAHFLLSHLSVRPTFRPRLFSVFELGFLHLQLIFAPVMSLFATLLRTPRYYLRSDLLGLQNSHVSSYEYGFFLKKLHDFDFHSVKNLQGAEYFSTLTAANHSAFKNFGQPSLLKRLVAVMGFAP